MGNFKFSKNKKDLEETLVCIIEGDSPNASKLQKLLRAKGYHWNSLRIRENTRFLEGQGYIKIEYDSHRLYFKPLITQEKYQEIEYGRKSKDGRMFVGDYINNQNHICLLVGCKGEHLMTIYGNYSCVTINDDLFELPLLGTTIMKNGMEMVVADER